MNRGSDLSGAVKAFAIGAVFTLVLIKLGTALVILLGLAALVAVLVLIAFTPPGPEERKRRAERAQQRELVEHQAHAERGARAEGLGRTLASLLRGSVWSRKS